MNFSLHEIRQILYKIFCSTCLPGVIVLLYYSNLILIHTLQCCLVVLFILYVVIPIVFRYYYPMQRGLTFLTFIKYLPIQNLSDPGRISTQFGPLYATRNFYIQYKDDAEPEAEHRDVKIGVWHILPDYIAGRFAKNLNLNGETLAKISDNYTIAPDERDEAKFKQIETLLGEMRVTDDAETERNIYETFLRKTKCSIVLYLHGNTASRGTTHRVELYQVLRKMGYHVIALDYRGFGDSNSVPSELGLVKDATTVYNYILNVTGSRNPIFVWGHSLGTAIATRMLSQIQYMDSVKPKSLILEAPFNNLKDEIMEHPFATPFKFLPWFDISFTNPMFQNNLRFESDSHIAEFRQPVCFLHAEDDGVVPFKLGYKLFRDGLESRGKAWGPMEFHRFDKQAKFGHKYICHAENLPSIVSTFFNNYRDSTF